MRNLMAVLSWALAASPAALASEAAASEEAASGGTELGALSLDSQATRYGTSYETVYLLSLEPRAALRLGSLELSALLPLSSSATYPSFCCRLALGNATLSALLRNAGRGLRHWYELGVSLPSSRWSDAHASSLAATAALLHDAGYYLPDTTTLRAGLGVEVDASAWLSFSASSAAHYWLRADGEVDPLLVPLSAAATLRWAQAWSTQAGYRGLLRWLDPAAEQERLLSELSLGIAHTWSGARLEASVSVPLDESLRQLGMLSIGTRYARSF